MNHREHEFVLHEARLRSFQQYYEPMENSMCTRRFADVLPIARRRRIPSMDTPYVQTERCTHRCHRSLLRTERMVIMASSG